MTSFDEILVIFSEKLQKTNSLDAALLKSIWIAYQKGREDALREVLQPPSCKWLEQK